ncbi:MAG: HD domain-containing protein [Clostridia bacterium]|nr:HD domain-containing protein [Clostridia bacterium]
MENKRLEKQLEFALEVNKEKNIFRQTHVDSERCENDAEHSWHIAVMIYLLREYANEEFDVAKAMLMALIHDVVEIDAGDTYAYDNNALSTQKEREQAAAERIFGILPQDQKQEMILLFNEFEECRTPEARFARVMDNLQPMMLNDKNNGADWKRHNVAKSQIYKRNEKTPTGSAELWEFMKILVEQNIEKGTIRDE